MKKNAGILLVLLIFVITLGCVVETIKPEVKGTTFKSVSPKVDVQVDPKFKYIGKFDEAILQKRGASAVIKYEVYVFGIMENETLIEAVAMMYQTLPDGWNWVAAVPRGIPYIEAGGYKWASGYRIGTPQYLFGKLGEKVFHSCRWS